MLSRARLLLLNAYHVLIDGLFDAAPVLLTFAALTFGAGEDAVGAAVALCTAACTAASLASVFLSRTLGFARTLGLVIVAGGAGYCAAAFSGGIVTAGVCFTVALAGHAVFHNIAFSCLTLHTERRRLGRVLSDFIAIGDIGRIPLVSLAAFAAAGSVAGLPGWRVVCFGYGAATLGAALWLLARSPQEAPPVRETARPGGTFPSFGLLKERELFLAMFANILNAFSNDRVFTFLPFLLLAKGMDPNTVASFALGFSLGSFFGKMACGRFVDRFGTRKVFIITQILLAMLLGVLLAAESLGSVIAIALLLGIVTKGSVPVIQTIITEPVRNPARYDDVFSINSFLRGLTNMLTPLLFGFMASAWSVQTGYVLMAAVAVAGILPVLALRGNPPPASPDGSDGPHCPDSPAS